MIVDPAYEAEQEERRQNTIKVIEEEARRRKVISRHKRDSIGDQSMRR